MDKALSGIRILDMTHVQAGPTSSQLMAFLGADVIKLESPMGDATRKQLRDVPNADSLYFTMLNCNKRSITVNLKNDKGKEVFTRLVKSWRRADGELRAGRSESARLRVGEGPRDQSPNRHGLHQGVWQRGPVRGVQGL